LIVAKSDKPLLNTHVYWPAVSHEKLSEEEGFNRVM